MTINFVKIEEVVDVNPRMSSELSSETDRIVDFIPMAQVSEEGRICVGESRKLGEVSKGYNYFANGDVLLAKITPCMENGKAAFVSGLPHGIGFGSTEFHVLRPSKKIDGRYLFYMLWNDKFRNSAKRNMTGSAGQKRVPKSFLERFPIPLPPLVEQKRIADILDKADAIRRKRQQTIELTEQFLRSTFLEMFGDPVTNPKGWPIVTLNELFAIPPNYGSMVVPNDLAGEYLDLRVANIQGGELNLTSRKYVDIEPKLAERHEVLDGDILLARAIGSREHLGKCFVAHPRLEKWAFDSHLMRIRLNTEIALPQFIRSYLASPGGRHEFLKHTRRSAVQFNVNTKEIARVSVPLPSMKDQKAYLTVLQKVRRAEKHLSTSENSLRDLFGSLVKRAFKGEL